MSHGHFFAAGDDLLPVTNYVEARMKLKYTLSTSYSSREFMTVPDAASIPALGKADGDQHIACSGYLITELATPVLGERIERFDGSVVFHIGQILNVDSIMFRPAGIWREGSVISGRIATISKSKIAQRMMRLYRSGLAKYFGKVNGYWVGPEAMRIFRAGGRLCFAIQSPPIYDLREGDNSAEVEAYEAQDGQSQEPLRVTSIAELMEMLNRPRGERD